MSSPWGLFRRPIGGICSSDKEAAHDENNAREKHREHEDGESRSLEHVRKEAAPKAGGQVDPAGHGPWILHRS